MDLKTLLELNPSADVEVIRGAWQHYMESKDVSQGYGLAIPYSMPVSATDLKDDDDPRFVKLSKRSRK